MSSNERSAPSWGAPRALSSECFEYAAVWSRRRWRSRKTVRRRVFESHAAAVDFLERIRQTWSDLSVSGIERRPVGAWEPVEEPRPC
jgi:hypothetical protein